MKDVHASYPFRHGRDFSPRHRENVKAELSFFEGELIRAGVGTHYRPGATGAATGEMGQAVAAFMTGMPAGDYVKDHNDIERALILRGNQ